MRFRVTWAGRNRYFRTLEAAVRFCNAVFERTKIVLGIERVGQ
jgi:hypothetical protein